MELMSGNTYATRDGRSVTVHKEHDGTEYPFVVVSGDDTLKGLRYTKRGEYLADAAIDAPIRAFDLVRAAVNQEVYHTRVGDIVDALLAYGKDTIIVSDNGPVFSIQEAHEQKGFEDVIVNISIHSWSESAKDDKILGKIIPKQ